MQTVTYDPEKHLLVPKEPTAAMVWSAYTSLDGTATQRHFDDDSLRKLFKAFVAAAPKPESAAASIEGLGVRPERN